MEKREIENFISKLKRISDSHKYDYGHVLVVAGSETMPGAGVLCCLGALRSGAGLVTYAVKNDFLNNACAMSRPEMMFFIYETASNIIDFIRFRKVSSVVIGPGLKPDFDALRNFIEKIIFSVDIPVILDASGLSCFSGMSDRFRSAKANLVITPHLGEFSKLLNKKSSTVKNNREKITVDFAKENSLICVLKGNNTIVSCSEETYKNDVGTPAMATAGSGDVLSGVISSFVSIVDNTFEAVKFAVFVHGLAGKFAEKDKGSAGVVASDIAENVCYAVKSLGVVE